MTPADRIFWRTNGYFVVERMLGPEEVRRVGEAFDREIARQFPRGVPTDETIAQAQRVGNWKAQFIDGFLDADPAFVALADHPRLMPVLTEAIGDDLILTLANAGSYPLGDPGVYWHSDLWHFIGMELARADCYMARALIFLDDVEREGGCLAYVPGSHRLDQRTIVHPPRFDDPADMPNCVRFAVPAGTAVVFNSYGWHARFPNRSRRPRRAVQFGYCHQWVQFLSRPIAPRAAETLADTDLRRQLFGLKTVDYSYEMIDRALRAGTDAIK